MSDHPNLVTTIEAVLFYRGEPMTIRELSKSLGVGEAAIQGALDALAEALTGRGIVLVRDGDRAALATAPTAAPVIEALRKDDLEGPLGKAGLETLAIIIYKHPVSRADIEYIRGVNCQAILRTLVMRGLVERVERERGRGYWYQPTPELPATLGVTRLIDLPEYDAMKTEIERVSAERQAIEEARDESHEGS